MPKINKMLLKLESFQYDTSLELDMGYYHIQVINTTSNLCTIILPQGKYCYKWLPMGISNSPEIFQHKMNDLFHGFEFIRVYIDDLLILTKWDWTDNVQKLYIEYYFFRKTEMEHLSFWVTHDGVKAIDKKGNTKYDATKF